MRIEREGMPAAQLARAFLDDADARVAVLDRRGKLTGLKRRAHPLELARRHAAEKDERFGAAADPAVQRANGDLFTGRRRPPFAANFANPWRGDPEGASRSHSCAPFKVSLARRCENGSRPGAEELRPLSSS